jgi:hypothetical protein
MDGLVDVERRVTRLEALTDERLVTNAVFDVHMANMRNEIRELRESNTWLMRFAVSALVGVMVNVALLAVSLVDK